MTILEYVKTKVDIEYSDGDDTFNDRLLIDIETALSELQQLTEIVIPENINHETEFSDVITTDDKGLIALCKSYIGLCVRLSFDPPSGSVLTSLEKSRDTIASRITIQPREESNE